MVFGFCSDLGQGDFETVRFIVGAELPLFKEEGPTTFELNLRPLKDVPLVRAPGESACVLVFKMGGGWNCNDDFFFIDSSGADLALASPVDRDAGPLVGILSPKHAKVSPLLTQLYCKGFANVTDFLDRTAFVLSILSIDLSLGAFLKSAKHDAGLFRLFPSSSLVLFCEFASFCGKNFHLNESDAWSYKSIV